MSHARLSPSSAPRWKHCLGSVALIGDKTSESCYADEGTAAHDVAAKRLLGQKAEAADQETSDYIDVYVNAINNAAEGKTLLVEQRVPISYWTTEKDAEGTSDAIIVGDGVLEVHDLKFGQGVIVDAPDNEQLALYALGSLSSVEPIHGSVHTIKMVIHQPRRDHISEWTISKPGLLAIGAEIRAAGEKALGLTRCSQKVIEEHLNPTEKGCRFCPVKATCPALTAKVHAEVFEDFADATLGPVTPKLKKQAPDYFPTAATLELITQWVASQYTRIEEALNAGSDVPGWKYVIGKRGNRKFKDEGAVEAQLAILGFARAKTHTESLNALTAIEKLVDKGEWEAHFKPMTVQADGKPTLVASSDPRPAYKVASKEDFVDTSAFV